ncbi:unnamed protein product [Cyprideis torosa]|uniref:Aminomethyltransferase n=1 Tax=Cyprideis torosa TaxID=163714 RepID=A0A7R8ZJT9_9CRUS|nr:unnamed protein product [Cyprideis torosa]CAG0883025.1 unnamed protein product [Cyprideis torosa]
MWRNSIRASSTFCSSLRKTCLHDFHVRKGGKMVEFAGYSMPVQYSDMGIADSHRHTREGVSIFDVSHMLQTEIQGKCAVEFMESMIVGDIKNLSDNTGTLSLFTNESGGIVDDLICNKISDSTLYVVSNAGRRNEDQALMEENMKRFRSRGKNVSMREMEEVALLAIQGPKAATILESLVEGLDLSELKFMRGGVGTVAGIPKCRITRCGYTGEDGVEISVPVESAEHVAEAVLEAGGSDAALAGLGARDSLRLEAGLCLYGNDIDETTTPVEAVLLWTVAKNRRLPGAFPGVEVIMQQIKQKPVRKRVGFVSTGPTPRQGAPIFSSDNPNEPIGVVTSGCPSPSLGGNVGMGYIPWSMAQVSTELRAQVRGRMVPIVVSKMPFVPTKYYM